MVTYEAVNTPFQFGIVTMFIAFVAIVRTRH